MELVRARQSQASPEDMTILDNTEQDALDFEPLLYFDPYKRWTERERATKRHGPWSRSHRTKSHPLAGNEFKRSVPQDCTSPMKPTFVEPHLHRSYRPFRATIDMEVIQSWRRQCQDTHGLCCNDRHSAALEQHLQELILVDVKQGCLVTCPSTTPFAALSYVWGGVQVLKTTSSTLSSLEEPGSLFKPELLPRTLRDAMHLAKTLDIQYLWVDSLCVIQDAPPRDMNNMLRAMAHIYASAEFTIVAAAGSDANHGLPGTGGASQTRKISPKFRPRELLRYQGYPEFSAWARRGWTFQESLFARRLLVFDEVVSWLCGKVVQCECFEDVGLGDGSWTQTDWPDERPHLGVPMGMMSLVPDLPSLGRWGMLVQDYSTRTLTFDDDAERAFAGATKIMASNFPGGILHGLPVFFFDIALLWYAKPDAARRPTGPSWSWTGWKESVDCWNRWYPHCAGVYRDTGDSSDWTTMAPLKPVATFQMTLPDAPPPPFNDFYTYQSLRADALAPLPPTWHRHTHAAGIYYTKSTKHRGRFRYTFPLPTAPSQQSSLENASRYLTCTAPLIHIHFHRELPRTYVDTPLEIHIASQHGSATLSFPSRFRSPIAAGTEGCLVALSEAVVEDSKRLKSWFASYLSGYHGSVPRCMADSKAEGFVNVLWVRWEEGVAYRVQVGIVGKDEWEGLGARVTTFVLG